MLAEILFVFIQKGLPFSNFILFCFYYYFILFDLMVAAKHLVQYNTMSVSTVYYQFLARYRIVNLNPNLVQLNHVNRVNK